MDNKLLCYFNFNNYFYEVFTDKDSKIYCKKFGTSKKASSISDVEIINNVIKKISEMKYKFFNTIEYNGEKLRLYLNLFNQKIYISKIENQKEVACDYYKYKKLYDMYNNPIIYNYEFLNNQDIFEGFNFRSDYLMDSNNPFNTTNGSNGTFGVFGEKNSTQPSLGYNVFSPSPSALNPTDSESNEEDNAVSIREERRRREDEKKCNRNKKIIKLIICGILVTVIVISSVVLTTKFKGENIEPTNETIIVEEIIENTDDKVLKEILESISDEEPWVIEQVIEQYQAENGIIQTEDDDSKTEDPNKETKVSKKTQKVINSINNNSNLTEKEKRFIVENFSTYFENNIKYIEDLDQLCYTLNNIQFVYDFLEEADIEELGKRGEYDPGTNIVTIYSDLEQVKTHEIGHAIGDFGVGASTYKLSEGYTELFNPNRDKSVYTTEQMMVLVLEQVYGKDFMRSSYFNRSLFSDIYDRFDINKQDTNIHWDLIRKCNSFLIKYEDYALDGFKTDEDILKEVKELFDELIIEYESLTGQRWEENELLKLCYDRFTGENTSGKNDYSIRDVCIDENGTYVYRIGKYVYVLVDVTEPTVEDLINGNIVNADLYSRTFDVTSDEIEIE